MRIEIPPINAWRRRLIARVLTGALFAQLPSIAILAWSLRAGGGWRWGLSLAVHLPLLSIFLRRLVFYGDARRTPWWIAWLIECGYTGLVTGSLVAWGPVVIAASIALATGHDPMPIAARVLCVGFALGLWGSTLGRAIPFVSRRTIPVVGLDPAFEGLRVVHISDVHCGPYVSRWMIRLWARRASQLGGELIALTGDYINSGEGYLDDVRRFVAALEAPSGVVACLGNHDYYGTTHGVVEALRDGGARLLRNEGFALTRGDAALWIAGIDDRWTQRDDLRKALEGRPDRAPTLLLAHDPASFPEASEAGVALTLSGHTHGGQLGLSGPLERINFARFSTRYSAGIFRHARSTLFVSRGIGTTAMPVRIGMWPELALLTLVRA